MGERAAGGWENWYYWCLLPDRQKMTTLTGREHRAVGMTDATSCGPLTPKHGHYGDESNMDPVLRAKTLIEKQQAVM